MAARIISKPLTASVSASRTRVLLHLSDGEVLVFSPAVAAATLANLERVVELLGPASTDTVRRLFTSRSRLLAPWVQRRTAEARRLWHDAPLIALVTLVLLPLTAIVLSLPLFLLLAGGGDRGAELIGVAAGLLAVIAAACLACRFTRDERQAMRRTTPVALHAVQ